MPSRIGERLEDTSSSEIFINNAGESLDSFFEQYVVAKDSDARLDLLKEHVWGKVNDELDELVKKYGDTTDFAKYGPMIVKALPIARIIAEIVLNMNDPNYLNEVNFNHLLGHLFEISLTALVIMNMGAYLNGRIANIESMLYKELDVESWLKERSKNKGARLEDRFIDDLTVYLDDDADYQEYEA
jgi:hypothetical protein